MNKVALVLEPEYGERLIGLAAGSHVWVVNTPTNRAAATEYWSRNPGHRVETGITTFKYAEEASRLETYLGILDRLDLHHAEYSSNPPYSELEVIGLPLTKKAKLAARDLGFVRFEQTAEGFRAVP
ncbi:MAG TPA: hypothetical protein VGQ39_03075 [Pyrinomonadaceae bacterium]|nr:hypothetical protein [Pyrinomonadaceae bacterium]